MPTVPLYDNLADSYDLMNDWPARLQNEGGFFQRLFEAHQVGTVLDAACGTGQHAVAFARWGLQVTGTDLSAAMVARAEDLRDRSAEETGGVPGSPHSAVRAQHAALPNPRFLMVGFGRHQAKAPGPFDAVTCLGNSLPHVLEGDALDVALADFRRVLRPGGLLILQNNNYDSIMSQARRFMGLASAESAGKEYLFFRFFDLGGETIVFHVLTFIKDRGRWSWHEDAARQRPLLRADLEARLGRQGFGSLLLFGDCQGNRFQEPSSPNLVLVATRT